MEMYCMHCRKKVEVAETKAKKAKSGRRMAVGECPECGTTVCKFVKKEK